MPKILGFTIRLGLIIVIGNTMQICSCSRELAKDLTALHGVSKADVVRYLTMPDGVKQMRMNVKRQAIINQIGQARGLVPVTVAAKWAWAAEARLRVFCKAKFIYEKLATKMAQAERAVQAQSAARWDLLYGKRGREHEEAAVAKLVLAHDASRVITVAQRIQDKLKTGLYDRMADVTAAVEVQHPIDLKTASKGARY